MINDAAKEILLPGERLDDLQRSGLMILQDPKRFCFGMDAVLLSGFAKAKKGDLVMDFCTGTGIIPLLLSAKTEAAKIYGLEIQEESADMANRSVLLNGLSDRVEIKAGDFRDAVTMFGASSFDIVTCNPPYMKDEHGIKNPSDAKKIARHEIYGSLEDLILTVAKILKQNGKFYMVHRPNRLVDVISCMRAAGIEPKRLQMVHPFQDREANMFLVEGVRGGKAELRMEKPIIVYKEVGVYTDEIYDIYGY